MSTERLGRTTDRVKDSRRTMMETEEIGVSILQDLHGQRQSLLRAHETVLSLCNTFTPYSQRYSEQSDKIR